MAAGIILNKKSGQVLDFEINECYNLAQLVGRNHKIILDSSMAEHPAVNRRVAGSSPARGALISARGLSP